MLNSFHNIFFYGRTLRAIFEKNYRFVLIRGKRVNMFPYLLCVDFI